MAAVSRKRKNVLLDNASFRFEDSRIMTINTQLHDHQLIESLNRIYDIGMTCVQSIDLYFDQSILLPCFCYYNEMRRLTCVMVSQPINGVIPKVFDTYNKMLIVRGRDAERFLENIHDQLSDGIPEPDPTDILAHDNWNLITQLSKEIFESHLFSFDPRTGIKTTMFNISGDKMPDRAKKMLNDMKAFIGQLFEIFEWHLSADMQEE